MHKHSIRLLVSATFVVGALSGSVLTGLAAGTLGSAIFRDIPRGSYYDEAVGRLYERGIITSTTDNQFRGTSFITRAEVAVMLDRILRGVPGPSYPIPLPTSSSSTSVGKSSSSSVASSNRSSRSASAGPQGLLGFSRPVFNISEGSKYFTGTVIRTGGAEGTVAVKYRLVPLTAKAADNYTDKTDTLVFGPGEVMKTFSIGIVDNAVGEINKQFKIVLDTPSGGSLSPISEATVVILDNDGGCPTCTDSSPGSSSASSTSSSVSSVAGAGLLGFSALGYNVMENDGRVAVTVTRNDGSQGSVNVNYTTANGTAQSGVDYTAVSGTLTFAAGETSKTILVPITNDNASRGYRTFTVNLALPTGGAVLRSPSSANVTIIDDEVVSTGSGSMRLESSSYSARQVDGKAVITVQRVGGTLGPVGISYSTFGKTAVAGDSFTAVSGTLTFAPFEATKTFIIPFIPKTQSFAGQTIGISISGPTGGALLGSPQEATLTITK